MLPLVRWARVEGVRVRPMDKRDEAIDGTLVLPDGRAVPFHYDRRALTLRVGTEGERRHPLEGVWQLDEFGVPTRLA